MSALDPRSLLLAPGPEPLGRRAVLGLIAAAAGAPVLAACGGSPTSSPTAGGTGIAAPGGTVRLAFAGGGATESLDPSLGTSPVDLARSAVVFDQLFVFVDGRSTPQLATAVDVEPDGSAFILHLREGVTWHDGRSLTAPDVVYSFARLADPDRPFPSQLSSYLDLAKGVAVDDLTVKMPTVQAVGDPATLIAGAGLYVVPKDATEFTVKQLVGTGPYRVTAFQPGNETRLRRHDDYWDGAPKADELVLLSIDDPTARVNATTDDQADYASDLPYATARTGVPSPDLEVRKAEPTQRTSYGFVLNTTRDLPADPGFRMALRLGVDRQALVDTVFLGYGETGNDLFGYGAMYYEDRPPLERDVERARELLEEAGALGKPFVIRSADYEVGLNSSAEVFAEQLRDLGLDATTTLVSVTEYFDEAGLAQADAVTFPLGPFSLAVTYTRSALYPTLAFPDDDLQTAVSTALATTSESERADAWATAQQVMADRGNWILWGRGDVLSLARKDLVGIETRESPKYPWLGKVGFRA